jgi:hypothetical protein
LPSQRTSNAILLALSAFALLGIFLVDPIPQDPAYHNFADDRQIYGISNFCNTISNLPFVFVGLLGLARVSRLTRPETRPGYLVLCVGVLLVACGSAYYHQAPSNESLIWDRLPMTIAFMALFAMILEERVLQKPAPLLLPVLVTSGIVSVLYWAWTEAAGRGDLRPYALVQFLPVVLIPLFILLFPQRFLANRLLLSAFLFYFVAKAFEHFDAAIFSAPGCMSGHALKHVAAAAAAFCIICAVPARRGTR